MSSSYRSGVIELQMISFQLRRYAEVIHCMTAGGEHVSGAEVDLKKDRKIAKR